MGKIHELKCWPDFFYRVWTGQKPFEVRRNDRDFQVGDTLLLKEYDPITQEYTERECIRQITYILKGGDFGIDERYSVLGLKDN